MGIRKRITCTEDTNTFEKRKRKRDFYRRSESPVPNIYEGLNIESLSRGAT